jgi:hypothetical protein
MNCLNSLHPCSEKLIALGPSDEAKARVANLILREKSEGLSPVEKSELDQSMLMEELMWLAKARARLSRASQNSCRQ